MLEFYNNANKCIYRHIVLFTWQHPNYGSGSGAYPNDIAVLIVNPMTLSDNAAAIELTSMTNAHLGSSSYEGSCRITGWGRTCGTCN